MSEQLNPDFPVVSGDYAMPQGWRVSLPAPFNRRIEEGSMVLWTPALTLWFDIWNNDRKAGADELLQEILARANPARTAEKLVRDGAAIRLTFELAENDQERPESAANSVNAFVIAASGYVQIAAYADTPEAQALAYRIVDSVTPG